MDTNAIRCPSGDQAGIRSSTALTRASACPAPPFSPMVYRLLAPLAEDFRNFASRAEDYVRQHGEGRDPNRGPLDEEDRIGAWWLESYRELRQAFELASDDGFVHFG